MAFAGVKRHPHFAVLIGRFTPLAAHDAGEGWSKPFPTFPQILLVASVDRLKFRPEIELY
jgi:hypothetical protein